MSESEGVQEAGEKLVSQEDLNRIVADRLAREREKYADYESLKEAAAKLAEIEEAQKSEQERQAERLAALEAENRSLALAKDKAEVAAEHGVPVELLAGDDRDALVAAAERLSEWRGEAASDSSGDRMVVPGEGTGGVPLALNSDGLEDSLKRALGIA